MPTPAIDTALILEAREAIKKHGSVGAAARALGIPRETLRGRSLREIPKEQKPQVARGKTLADFRKEHDKDFIVPQKIKTALTQLGDGWAYEMELCRMAGLSVADLGNYREQFADYYVVIGRNGKRAWAGSKTLAEKMREMVR